MILMLAAFGCARVPPAPSGKQHAGRQSPKLRHSSARKADVEKRRRQTDKLLKQLASDKYKEREKAQDGLNRLLYSGRGIPVLERLRQVGKTTTDPDVKVRLERMLEPFDCWGITGALLSAAPDTGECADAISFIRKCLSSGKDSIVIAACSAIQKIEDATWEKTLPELKKILEGAPCEKTDAAAAIVYERGYACEKEGFGWGISWHHFSDRPAAWRNICIYIILNEKDWHFRACATLALDWRNKLVVPTLIKALKDENPNVRLFTVQKLGCVGDMRAVEP
jgi:hypothetical protein